MLSEIMEKHQPYSIVVSGSYQGASRIFVLGLRVRALTFVHLSVDGFTSPEIERDVHEPSARVAKYRGGTSKIGSSPFRAVFLNLCETAAR